MATNKLNILIICVLIFLTSCNVFDTYQVVQLCSPDKEQCITIVHKENFPSGYEPIYYIFFGKKNIKNSNTIFYDSSYVKVRASEDRIFKIKWGSTPLKIREAYPIDNNVPEYIDCKYYFGKELEDYQKDIEEWSFYNFKDLNFH